MKIREIFFQFELHISESQDCSVQVSQRLVSKKLHVKKKFQVKEGEAKREIHYIKKIYWVSIVNLLLRAYRVLDCVKLLCNSSPL